MPTLRGVLGPVVAVTLACTEAPIAPQPPLRAVPLTCPAVDLGAVSAVVVFRFDNGECAGDVVDVALSRDGTVEGWSSLSEEPQDGCAPHAAAAAFVRALTAIAPPREVSVVPSDPTIQAERLHVVWKGSFGTGQHILDAHSPDYRAARDALLRQSTTWAQVAASHPAAATLRWNYATNTHHGDFFLEARLSEDGWLYLQSHGLCRLASSGARFDPADAMAFVTTLRERGWSHHRREINRDPRALARAPDWRWTETVGLWPWWIRRRPEDAVMRPSAAR